VTTPTATPIVEVRNSEPATNATEAKTERTRFEVDPEFTVQTVLGPNETGSLIAMEFNEFGKLLLSREGGPLLIADPTKPINDPERVRVYCDQVNTCQGILPLNGNVYVTANGPEGSGIYVLADSNRDGMLEIQKLLKGFTGAKGEHGPHGLRLGPDGMLYVILGNGCQIEGLSDLTSPYRHTYEGDLIPRFEDPGGHAVGVKAPGGTIVRISLDGKKVETVAGGIRNAYDMVFDQNGELFIHDSDMESDIGTTWYRPTMVFHVPDGAEFGWRSGSAKFATHFADQTPPICDTGRGSPTGAALYQHLQFPIRYHDTMFLADWSEGRILALRPQPEGAGFVATTETFLKGRPLNVCDLTVGEDGALYFCTGGRGTAGGVYRVVWNGEIPKELLEFESDLAKAIRHPQPDSAWSRQNIAQIKIQMGENWNPSIVGVAKEKRNSEKLRMRALQLMVLYGPQPTDGFLREMSQDESPVIRAQIARLCGLAEGMASESVLKSMTADDSPTVRRMACESLMRLGAEPQLSTILGMLSSADRIESLTARRLIERIPAERWEQDIFSTDNKRVFIQGSIALLTAEPTLDRSYQVLAKASKVMEGFVNDYDFVDLLRTMELALVRGKVEPSKVPGLVERIGNEFPSGNSQINQELVRILAYLKVGDLSGRIGEYLSDPEVPQVDKVHLGTYLQSAGDQLSPDARMAIINSLESASTENNAGGSYKIYLQTAVKRLSEEINNNDANYVLKNGEKMPTAVIAAFYKLPQKLDPETVQLVIDMDQRMRNSSVQDTPTSQARLGVIAVLARSGDETSMNYLRQLWQDEPGRRTDISIGLAQQPEGANWAYLVSSIPILDDLTGIEVLEKLTTVSRRPRDPKHFSDVISLGYRMHGEGTDAAVRLLEHWSGERMDVQSSDWKTKLGTWHTWYDQKFPQGEAIQVSQQQQPVGRYSVSQLLTNMQTGLGNAQRGHDVFSKAQCATCHRVGNLGENVGPDLTNLAQRFSMREAIESTIDPSKVIPDRYASKKIMTTDGNQFAGMAVQQADGSYFILQNDGKRIRIKADDVDQVAESTTSAMPAGLLDGLSESEIKDLFTFMMQSQQQATASSRTQSETVSQVEVAPVIYK